MTWEFRQPERLRVPGVHVALSCILLSGCAHYEPAPLEPAETLNTLEARTLDDPRLRTFVEASLGPERAIESRSWDLAALTAAAVYYHPDIELAQSRFQGAQAALVTARQLPNPTLALSASFSPSTVSPAIDFLLETFGRREYRAARAEALIDAARQDVATAIWQVRGRVRTALLALSAAERRVVLENERLTKQEQLVGLLERRLAEGVASALDVARERVSRDQVSLAVREAEAQRDTARAELASAVGVPLSALDGVTVSFGAFERGPSVPSPETVATLSRQALLERPDLRGLLAEHAAADAALRLEIARQFPALQLGLGYNYEFGVDEYEPSVSMAAELPVLNRNQGPIAEAEAGRRAAAAQLTGLQASILGAIDSALESYDAATRTVTTAEVLLAAARDRGDRVARAFAAGAVNRVALVSVQIEVALAELASFDAELGLFAALGALEDALQQPLLEPDAHFFVSETGVITTQGGVP